MRYGPGSPVRVAARAHAGHHRTPAYVKGKTGRVERVHGRFRNPETRAYGGDGRPEVPLYLVAFPVEGLRPDATGHPGDRVFLDLFEHWLEDAE